MAVLPNKILAVGESINQYGTNVITLFDIDTGKNIGKLKVNGTERTGALAFLPDGRLLSGHDDGSIRVWDVEKQKCLEKLKEHKEDIYHLIVLSDGGVISGSRFNDKKGSLKLWDMNPKKIKCLATFSAPEFDYLGEPKKNKKGVIEYNLYNKSFLHSVVLLPNGLLASTAGDKEIMLWNVKTAQYVSSLHTSNAIEKLLPFSNGLLLGSSNKGIEIWDTQQEKEKLPVKKVDKNITHPCILSDNIFLEGNSTLYQYMLKRPLKYQDIERVVAYFWDSSLENINLSNIEISYMANDFFIKVAQCRNLKVLNLTNTNIPESSIAELYRYFMEQGRPVEIIHESIETVRKKINSDISNEMATASFQFNSYSIDKRHSTERPKLEEILRTLRVVSVEAVSFGKYRYSSYDPIISFNNENVDTLIDIITRQPKLNRLNFEHVEISDLDVERIYRTFVKIARSFTITHKSISDIAQKVQKETQQAKMSNVSTGVYFQHKTPLCRSEQDYINHMVVHLRGLQGIPTRSHLKKETLIDLDSQKIILLKAIRGNMN